MKLRAKSIAKNAIRRSLPVVRRQLNKHPLIKNHIARFVRSQFNATAQVNTDYQARLGDFFPDAIDCLHFNQELTRLTYQPLISIVVPTYNTDHQFLRDCLDSVKSQIYENWELCIVDDGSSDVAVRAIVKEYATADKRIRYKFLKTNKHIAGATNEAIAMAKGEFIVLFDHDDILWPNALYEVIRTLNDDPKADFLYTDEDKISENRHIHFGPFFKPDWNPDFLHSVNYITHLAVIRAEVLRQVGGLREQYNGAQDWDLFLRIGRLTSKIVHIPKVTYSWRVHDLSTAKSISSKPYVVEAQRQAITDDLKARGYDNAKVEQDKNHPGYWQVTYPVIGDPLISIIIPSKDQFKILRRCIRSIYLRTTYKNFEVVVVDTGSTDKRVLRYYKHLKRHHNNFTVIDWPEKPFSYARSCNIGAATARGELLVMLNNDTEVITPNWLEIMAGDAQRKEIGAVGCLLFFPDGYHIQHAGVGVGLGGLAANSFSMMTLEQPLTQTQHLMLNTRHDMTAVTAACLMMRKNVFEQIGGFNEAFRVTYNDVDLCLRLVENGYRNLYTPYARLLHHESVSVGSPAEARKRDTEEFKAAAQLFANRWEAYIRHDPNINSNLNKNNAFYDVRT